jgi:DNA-binding transcriptional MerR regulator|nr:helix-turn-helix domain-containing protein [uncultured Alistipes sp.]
MDNIEVCRLLHISRRTLQNYRDKGIISYASVGGTLLYPESKIDEVPERNYYKPRVFGR